MKVLIVYAHPEPTSFNGALKDAAVAALAGAGHDVVVSDLYASGFGGTSGRGDFLEMADPKRFDYQKEQLHAVRTGTFVPEIRREQERVAWSDAIVLQFPLWWFGLPGLLKAWIDRVFAFGFAYDLEHRFDRGMLQGRVGLISVTTGGTPQRFSPEGIYGDIDYVLRPVQKGVLQYVGLHALEPFVAYAAPRVTDDERHEMLARYVERLGELAAASGRLPEARRVL